MLHPSRIAVEHYFSSCKTYYSTTRFNVVQGEWFAEVVAVDGFGMFVRKEVWKANPFDEKMLTGFHCYDVDFSLQIAVSKRYRNLFVAHRKFKWNKYSKEKG